MPSGFQTFIPSIVKTLFNEGLYDLAHRYLCVVGDKSVGMRFAMILAQVNGSVQSADFNELC
jgi:hypothetical protein